MKFDISEKVGYFVTVSLSFLFINKRLRLNELKTRNVMNAKILVFVTCAESIKYLLLHSCMTVPLR